MLLTDEQTNATGNTISLSVSLSEIITGKSNFYLMYNLNYSGVISLSILMLKMCDELGFLAKVKFCKMTAH